MSPYDEGRAAAASGVTNPYAEGTYPYAEWSRGFGGSEESSASDAAFDEGRAAAAAGQERDGNPYDDATGEEAEQAERWFAGYDSAAEAEAAALAPAEPSGSG